MDETSYSDQRVIELVKSRFIPVRVDVDRRPDISLRYNQGGFPSVAFLTGTGEFLAGRPYTPPDEMVALLERISGGEFAAGMEHGAVSVSSTGEKPNASVDAVIARLSDLYDEEVWRVWAGTKAASVGGFAVPLRPLRTQRRPGRSAHGGEHPSGNVARHLRPQGSGLFPLLGEPRLEGAPLREDAGQQRQLGDSLPGSVPDHAENGLPNRRPGDTGLSAFYPVRL